MVTLTLLDYCLFVSIDGKTVGQRYSSRKTALEMYFSIADSLDDKLHQDSCIER